MCDNNLTVLISKNLVFHDRTKHINIKFYFIKKV